MKARLELTTFFGISLSMTVIIISILLSGGLLAYIDLASFLIVVCGTFLTASACFTFEEIVKVHPILLKTIFYPRGALRDSAYIGLTLAELVQRKGSLYAHQNKQKYFKQDKFLYDAIDLLADNLASPQIENILREKINAIEARHRQAVNILRRSGEIAPAMGLIGTLIGLIRMLGNLDDVNMIGPAMAVALLTTFYGAILSYLIFYPLSAKLEKNSEDEVKIYQLYFITVVSIAKKENPRQTEISLNSILPADEQINFFKY